MDRRGRVPPQGLFYFFTSKRPFLVATKAASLPAMAAGVATETLVVALGGEETQLSVLSFVDRRGRKPYRRKQFLLVRGLERLLFNVQHGQRSTGAFAAHLGKCSMSESVLCCERDRVNDGTIKDDEFQAGQSASVPQPPTSHSLARARTVLAAMRPLVDVESRNRLRKVSVVPLTIAVSALTEFGRTDCTSAILRACNKVRVCAAAARSSRKHS